MVLSANSQSNTYYTDALRNIPVGSTITLTATASSEEWNDVEYAVGALYSLVENGAVVSGLPTGVNPRTAVGQKADGTLVFYTIDGRSSGHSIGASLTQVAQRLIELGCVTAIVPGRRRLHHHYGHPAGRHHRRHHQPPLRRQRAGREQPAVPGGHQ